MCCYAERFLTLSLSLSAQTVDVPSLARYWHSQLIIIAFDGNYVLTANSLLLDLRTGISFVSLRFLLTVNLCH